MTQLPLYVDISSWQPENIDWAAYVKWSSQWDGVSRVAMRSSFGDGYTDAHFAAYRANARSAGVQEIIYYHYAYPQYNTAAAEADWQAKVVGSLRAGESLMLDYEEQVDQATADWAYQWLARQGFNYGGVMPIIYANDAYVRARLQDGRLALYPLALANWQNSQTEHPPCPPPWLMYTYLQYTDAASNVPGIAGKVDADIFCGPLEPPALIKAGWTDNGSLLKCPNGVAVTGLFREYVLSHDWDPGDWALTAAVPRGQLEVSNPGLGGGVMQIFTKSVLEIPEATGKVQPMYCGKELKAIYEKNGIMP